MQLLGNKCIIVFPVILPIRCRGYIVFLRINFIYSIHRQADIFISMVKKRYGGYKDEQLFKLTELVETNNPGMMSGLFATVRNTICFLLFST